MSNLYLDKNQINNFNQIINDMLEEGISPNTLSMEHIGDIISFLDADDKKRNLYDPELKKAVFTIIKELLSKPQVEINFQSSSIPELRRRSDISNDELFQLLDKYWEIYQNHLTDRDYMIMLKKRRIYTGASLPSKGK
jgi:hypothetical protein